VQPSMLQPRLVLVMNRTIVSATNAPNGHTTQPATTTAPRHQENIRTSVPGTKRPIDQQAECGDNGRRHSESGREDVGNVGDVVPMRERQAGGQDEIAIGRENGHRRCVREEREHEDEDVSHHHVVSARSTKTFGT
jgi:hypothetical protein